MAARAPGTLARPAQAPSPAHSTHSTLCLGFYSIGPHFTHFLMPRTIHLRVTVAETFLQLAKTHLSATFSTLSAVRKGHVAYSGPKALSESNMSLCEAETYKSQHVNLVSLLLCSGNQGGLISRWCDPAMTALCRRESLTALSRAAPIPSQAH